MIKEFPEVTDQVVATLASGHLLQVQEGEKTHKLSTELAGVFNGTVAQLLFLTMCFSMTLGQQ